MCVAAREGLEWAASCDEVTHGGPAGTVSRGLLACEVTREEQCGLAMCAILLGYNRALDAILDVGWT